MKNGRKRAKAHAGGYNKGNSAPLPRKSKKAKAVIPKFGNTLLVSVLAIDPGITGAFVVTNGVDLNTWPMPVLLNGKDKEIDFHGVLSLLGEVQGAHGTLHTALERAVPMAMGVKGAFNYGRGFQTILDALAVSGFPYTLVEPSKWTKEMHEGISQNLKSKARSLIAVRRLYPKLMGSLPKKPKGGLQDGPVDALLIAGYWLRKFLPTMPKLKDLIEVKEISPSIVDVKSDDIVDFF